MPVAILVLGHIGKQDAKRRKNRNRKKNIKKVIGGGNRFINKQRSQQNIFRNSTDRDRKR